MNKANSSNIQIDEKLSIDPFRTLFEKKKEEYWSKFILHSGFSILQSLQYFIQIF